MKKLKNTIKEVLPKRVINGIKSLRKKYTDVYALKSYSQEGEDMILRRIFENKDVGFYIDVGAHHPKRFSNTYYFYKKGWNGINIDAMPNSMKAFDKFRKRDINIEAAISNVKSTLTYYEFNETALNGFSKDISLTRSKLESYSIVNSYPITTKTLNEVLDMFSKEILKEIDFITIDVEGLDFNVLKSLDLNKYKPNLILIEILSETLEDVVDNEISFHLKKFGYKIYAKSFNTVFYISEEYQKKQ